MVYDRTKNLRRYAYLHNAASLLARKLGWNRLLDALTWNQRFDCVVANEFVSLKRPSKRPDPFDFLKEA
jgi:hypothetical protein